MANLLPPAYQKKVRRALYARSFAIAGAVASACALVAFIALVPSYVAVRSAMSGSASPTSPVLASMADRAEITQAGALSKLLNPFLSATTSPTQAIRAALLLKPAGVSLDRITYTAGSSGVTGQIQLSGASASPDLLTAYRDVLAKDPDFVTISVPVGDLVGTSDHRFTITLTGHF